MLFYGSWDRRGLSVIIMELLKKLLQNLVTDKFTTSQKLETDLARLFGTIAPFR